MDILGTQKQLKERANHIRQTLHDKDVLSNKNSQLCYTIGAFDGMLAIMDVIVKDPPLNVHNIYNDMLKKVDLTLGQIMDAIEE